MVSIMDVDMAAALIVASHDAADALGVPAERRVYLRGWCQATDPVYVAEHQPLWASPAMAAAGREALGCAGVGIDDIAHLDLYSCFASSVGFSCDALGLRADDPRGLTVTGGLPFAGGPGSGYLLHSTATMVDRLRRHPGTLGLVSGVGMHMTKHAFDVYSTDPPPSALPVPDEAGIQARLDAATRPAIREVVTGTATVATYTVVHDRAGEREWGVAVCDLPGGDRAYARVEDPALLDAAETTEWVGAEVALVGGAGGVNVVEG